MTSQSRGVESTAIEPTSQSRTPNSLPIEHLGSPSAEQSASFNSSNPFSTPRPPPGRLKSASISQPSRPPTVSNHRHTASNVPYLPRTKDISPPDQREKSQSRPPNFLTSLAAQERRVLEIKEDLQKAEEELRKLKKEWASHESSKRRNDGRRLHQMRPMSTASARVTAWKDDPDGSSAWMYEEMERRKALMGRGRTSSRRVFTGSRNPRPLSLVARRPPNLPDVPETRRSLDERPQTTPDLVPDESDRFSPTSFYRSASSSPQRHSASFAGGKQLATEWKEGLWTFFEDLKHAAVGDEPRMSHNSAESPLKKHAAMESGKQRPRSDRDAESNNIPEARPTEPDSDATVIDLDSLIDDESDIFIDQGFPKPPTTKTPRRSTQTPSLPLHTRVIDGETWQTWDSPDAKQPTSAHSSNNSTSASNKSPSPQTSTPASSTTTSADATPRQSIVGPEKTRDSIPWPALDKLAPGKLTRTASHLIDEWEKSAIKDAHRDNKDSKKSVRRNGTPPPGPLPG